MAQTGGLDVLVSIFVDYPELNSVKYQAQQDILTVEIVLNSQVEDFILTRFMDQVKQSLKLYGKLTGTAPRVIDMDYTCKADITFVKLNRDGASLSEKEMELFVSMVKNQFESILLKEMSGKISKTNCQKQIKRSLLDGEHNSKQVGSTVIAYRDEGTMFVFNKQMGVN